MTYRSGLVGLAAIGAAFLAAVGNNGAQAPPAPPAKDSASAASAGPDRASLEAAWEKGASALSSFQKPDGAWHAWGQPHIGFTALAIHALAGAPAPLRAKHADVVKKGVDFILSRQQEDGSFCNPDRILKNYNTCVAVLALTDLDAKAYAAPIRKAQDWIIRMQTGAGIHAGGAGYGDTTKGKDGKEKVRDYADMNNTAFALEALNASGLDPDSEYFKRAAAFITRCQNSSETNTDPAILARLKEMGLVPGDDGGLYYTPTESKALEPDTNPDGSKSLRSYGSMTYTGIKSFIYANVAKDDPRVRAAVYWIGKNYTLEHNPGLRTDARPEMGQQGVYYYYYCFAKALDALGDPTVTTADGKVHEWPKEVLAKLLSLQKPDGTWSNPVDRWEEGDPGLVTSYVLMTLNTLAKRM